MKVRRCTRPNIEMTKCDCCQTAIGRCLNARIISKVPKSITNRPGFDWQPLVLPIMLHKKHDLQKLSMKLKLLQHRKSKISPLLTYHEKDCVQPCQRLYKICGSCLQCGHEYISGSSDLDDTVEYLSSTTDVSSSGSEN